MYVKWKKNSVGQNRYYTLMSFGLTYFLSGFKWKAALNGAWRIVLKENCSTQFFYSKPNVIYKQCVQKQIPHYVHVCVFERDKIPNKISNVV